MPDGSGRWPVQILEREGPAFYKTWVVARRLGGVNSGNYIVAERRFIVRLDRDLKPTNG